MATHKPDFVSPPGDTLAELLEEQKMSPSELAQRTGQSIKTINAILRGEKALTIEIALQFERVLGVSASFWIHRDQRYQTYLRSGAG